jgi:transposase
METLSPCRAGLDVHKKTVVACVRRVAPDGQVTKQVQSFGIFTDDLLTLADWLATQGATRVALEATGVSWKPVWSILEAHGGFELMLVNAQHIKQVPGRKTDVKDAEWIAELLQHGLLRLSFVPPSRSASSAT